MFQAPRKNTVAARRYKGVINAKRGRNDNSYREEHQDSHCLFARVAYRLELAAMFADETAVFSCDDMNKLKVGAAARSEEHTSELQSRQYLVCRLLLEKKKKKNKQKKNKKKTNDRDQ